MPRQSRTFRIFVSSTFSDLKEERNALQREVFPKLRELCMQHGCRFQAIDLRWGIREEASLDQQTMKICLEEIARCQKVTPRPNFIVLLGDRYGWRPLPCEIPADEFEQILALATDNEKKLLNKWYWRDDNAVPPVCDLQPRTGQYKQWDKWEEVERSIRSILLRAIPDIQLSEEARSKYIASATEQEIIRGALKVKDASEHVFCFFRKIRKLPKDESAKDFIDLDENGEPDEEASTMLADLKKRLTQAVPDNAFEYEAEWQDNAPTGDHLNQLCQDVLKSLTRVIEAQIDQIEDKDPLEQEIEDHEAFGKERSKFFTGRAAILQTIAQYIEGSDPHPMVIFGESGTGKTALIAQAAEMAQEEHRSAKVVYRFIAATPESSDLRLLLKSVCRQIAKAYGRDDSAVPDDYSELVRSLPERLGLATKGRPLIVFLDAMDQLSDRHDARSLSWLPIELPLNVRLIVSTLPGECLSVIQKQRPKSKRIELKRMPAPEARELLRKWLDESKRTLQEHQEAKVLAGFAECGLPLYLKLAFDETRRWRSYDKENALSHDLAGIVNDLFNRLSSDANHGLALVSESLGYLVAAKNGLTEDELLDILSENEEVMADFLRRSPKSPKVESLPPVVWLRLYHDLEPYLTERSADAASLMTLYHRQLNNITVERFLDGQRKVAAHERLAKYFSDLPLWTGRGDGQVPNLRKLSELPHQLRSAAHWDDLAVLLTDLDFFQQAWGRNEDDVKAWWVQIEENSGNNVVDAYRSAMEAPTIFPSVAIGIGGLLYWSGHLNEALNFYRRLEDFYRENDDKPGLQASLGGQAVILYDRGDLDSAMKLLKEQEAICRELGLKQDLVYPLGNQALILKARGDLDGAMDLFKQQETICREIEMKRHLAGALGNQASILHARGDLDGALDLLRQQETICREMGQKEGLQYSLSDQAVILHDRGELDGAMDLFKQQEEICRELGLKEGLDKCLGNQAVILLVRGDLDRAMALLKQQEAISREMDFKNGLQYSLGNQAVILQRRGHLDGAMKLLKEQEAICREMGRKDSLQRSLGNQALVLKDRGDLDGAMGLFKQQEAICREMGLKDSLQGSLGNQALILQARSDLGGAMKLLKQQEAICREMGLKDSLQYSLGNQAVLILEARGDLDRAAELLKQQEVICRETGLPDSLARSLANQAVMRARDLGQRDSALPLIEEAYELVTKHGFTQLIEQIGTVLDSIRNTEGI